MVSSVRPIKELPLPINYTPTLPLLILRVHPSMVKMAVATRSLVFLALALIYHSIAVLAFDITRNDNVCARCALNLALHRHYPSVLSGFVACCVRQHTFFS